MGFRDSYKLIWWLEDDKGNLYREVYDNISLSDFETIYGNNSQVIKSLDLTNEWSVE